MTRATETWTGATDDAAIPPRVKLRVFERAKGRCQKCTRKLRPGHWDADHIVAIINGGSNSEDNLQALCKSPCHSRKTRDDVAEKSRTYKRRKSSAGIRKPRTMRQWRKMDGTPVFASRER